MSVIQHLARREAGLGRKRHPGALASVFPTTWNKRRRRMMSGDSKGTQTVRDDTMDGAKQVGQGLQVTIPPAVPHLYNNNYTVRLTYAENLRHDIAQTGASVATQVYRTDTIFDPDVSGTGHQPIMRDLWASMYDYYAVLACEYQIKLYNSSGQDPVTYTAVGTSGQIIGPVNVTTLATTNSNDYINSGVMYPMAEMKNTRTEWLLPDKSITFKGTITPGDYIVDAKDSDSDNTWTAMGSSPSIARYLGYVITPGNMAAIVGLSETPYSHIMVQVILNYTVQFTQVNPSLRETPS